MLPPSNVSSALTANPEPFRSAAFLMISRVLSSSRTCYLAFRIRHWICSALRRKFCIFSHSSTGTFRELSGVPMVLNTSFNENEPVVCTAQEALDCFLRTKMDVLVLGEWVVERL